MEIKKLDIHDYAMPMELSPEVRYQNAHNAIDRGLKSDKVLSDLFRACVELGHVGEAARVARKICDSELRYQCQHQLEEGGVFLLGHGEAPPTSAGARRQSTKEESRQIPPWARGTARPDVPQGPPKKKIASAPAPATRPPTARPIAPRPAPGVAAPAGGSSQRSPHAKHHRTLEELHPGMSNVERRTPQQEVIDASYERESIASEILDAVEYLLVGAMPARILGLIALFPVGIAVAFLLPKDEAMFWTPYAPLLPVLLGLGLFFHYCTSVILHSSIGESDAPPIFTGAGSTICGSWRSLWGALGLFVICLGPAVLAALVEQPQMLTLSLGAAGLFYMPMAFLAMAVNGCFEAVLPRTVFRGMLACAFNYFKLFGVFALGTSLAILGALSLADSPLYLQLSVAGPLLVLPGIALARLLGRYYYAHRRKLEGAIILPKRAMMAKMSARIRCREGFPGPSSRRKGLNAHDKKACNNHGWHRAQTEIAATRTNPPAHAPVPEEERKAHAHTPLRTRR